MAKKRHLAAEFIDEDMVIPLCNRTKQVKIFTIYPKSVTCYNCNMKMNKMIEDGVMLKVPKGLKKVYPKCFPVRR